MEVMRAVLFKVEVIPLLWATGISLIICLVCLGSAVTILKNTKTHFNRSARVQFFCILIGIVALSSTLVSALLSVGMGINVHFKAKSLYNLVQDPSLHIQLLGDGHEPTYVELSTPRVAKEVTVKILNREITQSFVIKPKQTLKLSLKTAEQLDILNH